MTQDEFIVAAQFLIERADKAGIPLTTIEGLLELSIEEYIEENYPDYWEEDE